MLPDQMLDLLAGVGAAQAQWAVPPGSQGSTRTLPLGPGATFATACGRGQDGGVVHGAQPSGQLEAGGGGGHSMCRPGPLLWPLHVAVCMVHAVH